MSVPEVSAAIGAMVVAVAEARGADPAALARASGFDPASAADPDARFPLAAEQRLWREAAALSGDEAFGVHAAELVQPGAFDVLDYAIRTAPTLRASLERLVRYNRLVHDVAVWSLSPRGALVRIEHVFRSPNVVQDRHGAEFTITSIVTVGAQISGSAVPARAVGFRHAAPSAPQAIAELKRVLGVRPSFLEPVNFVEIDASVLDRPNPKADPRLARLVERHAEALLAARPPESTSTADRVRGLLASAMGEGATTISATAVKLKMSERSLQRRLSEEGVTFDGLLDEVRRELALRYLADPKIAVAEVAYLLGYSEPSPFHRAFKRWTGKTPTEMRGRAA